MIAKIKEWLSEFRPHLVTDGELWAVRKRKLLGFRYYGRMGDWWTLPHSFCLFGQDEANTLLSCQTFKYKLRKVDPKNPVREGGEKWGRS